VKLFGEIYRGMNLAPVDVEHVGAERPVHVGVNVWPTILPEGIRRSAVEIRIRSQS